MSTLHQLAEEAGVERCWHDVEGRWHEVAEETLRAVLAALDLPASGEAEIDASRRRLAELRKVSAWAFLTATVGEPVSLPGPITGPAVLKLESGAERPLELTDAGLPPIEEPGYHRLEHSQGELHLAIAPSRAFTAADLAADRRPWGVSAQLPSLRADDPSPFGDLGTLARSIAPLARAGVDLVAISPVHALFPADPGRFSPYGPSSRSFVNALLADLRLAGDLPPPCDQTGELIAWEREIPRRLAALRAVFDCLDQKERRRLTRFGRLPMAERRAHALFDALDTHFRGQGTYGWQNWPQEYHDPAGVAATAFARANREEIAFHLFLQGLAQRSLAAAQREAGRAGMRVGLITDLAVGIDPGGSDTWRAPHAFLNGLSVGAPPDPLGPEGQDWGLTTFDPLTLPLDHFHAFRDTLAAAMAHAGGVRIDHILGLNRLWVIPRGRPSTEGCYLRFPLADMLRILALESHRHRAIVVGEDLGTIPEGLRDALDEAGIAGMRVLWFERDGEGAFTDPASWDQDAAAMTSTHDLATLAGWWQGRDIEWTWKIGRKSGFASRDEEQGHRAHERDRLWQRLVASGHAEGDPPPPGEPDRYVTAACAHVAASACDYALIPLEDLAGLPEQPNLPGTIDQHPNWRRRLPASIADLLAEPAIAARARSIAKARNS